MSGTEHAVYVQCGMRILSEIDLHLQLDPGPGWDIDVRWGEDISDSRRDPPGEVIAAYESGDDRWYTATSTRSGYRLRFRDCGEFVVSEDLSEIQVRRDRSGRAELLPILLAGTVTAFILALRGETVLHASAVAVDGAALAFVGPSGRGKSTLAALLCAAGAPLVTDDVLTVDVRPPVTCIGGTPEIRLREKASVLVRTRRGITTRRTADQRLAFAPLAATRERLPLAAIVFPAPSREAAAVEIQPLPPSAALVALLAFPRVHGWRRPDVLTRDFHVLGQVVNHVPAYGVTIPWGPPFGPEVARSLSRLVASDASAHDPLIDRG